MGQAVVTQPFDIVIMWIISIAVICSASALTVPRNT
jgi:hypothetical protein